VLVDLNQNALNNKKLSVVNMDAFEWVKKNDQKFDFIIIDFPDPSSFSLANYTLKSFIVYLEKMLSLMDSSLFKVHHPMWRENHFGALMKL
jgi:spermidine synthase